MVKKRSIETAELFSLPDSIINISSPISESQKQASASRKKSAAGNTKSAPNGKAIKGQAYLPGLSRRGRPRSPNPIAPTVRAAESRRKRIESGARRIELMLAPDVAERLDKLTQHLKESKAEILSRLILKAAQRILG